MISYEDLEGMSTDELFALNRKVIQAIKEKQRKDAVKALSLFRVGETVQFVGPKNNQIIMGTIKSINEKTASLHNCSDGANWRVSPSYLRKVDQGTI